MKKNIILFLVFALLIGTFSVNVSAQDAVNVALHKEATASSYLADSNNEKMANDGINDNASYTSWKSGEGDDLPYWQVDLGLNYQISRIEIESAISSEAEERCNFEVIGANEKDFSDGVVLIPEVKNDYGEILAEDIKENAKIRYIKVRKTQAGKLSIGEIRVFAQRNEAKEGEKVQSAAGSYYGTFNDIEGKAFENDVYLLASLGIMNGYEDGNFNPDNRITRAEFAAVAVRILGYCYSESESTFYDVPKSHWANAYVETAAKAKLVNGVGNGLFAPDNYVTKQQVVKILVSLLGYGGAAEVNGGYPSGYENIASEIDLYDGIKFASGEEITRGEIAQLCANALHLPKVNISQVGENVIGTVYKDNLLMTENLGIKKNDGIVKMAGGVSLTADAPKKDKGMIQIGEETYKTEIPDAKKYLGLSVDYYYNESDEVVAISVRRKNNVLEIDAEDLIDIEDKILIYEDENEDKEKVEISYVCDVIYNGVALKDYEEKELIIKSGSVKLIDNNGDSVYDVYIINEQAYYVVSYVNVNQEMIYAKNSKDIIDADGDYVTIVKKSSKTNYEESEISLNEIKEWNIISVSKSKNASGEKRVKITVCDDEIIGKLTEKSTRHIAIDGTKYEIGSIYQDDVTVGEEGIFYLDSNGKVSAFNGEGNGVLRYGYLLGVNKKSGIDEDLEFKIFASSGNVEIYKTAEKDKFKIDGKDADGFDAMNVYLKQSGREIGKIHQAVKYSLNTKNELTDLYTVQAQDYLTKDYDSQTRYYKSTSVIGMQFAIDNDTVMLKIPDDVSREDEFGIITSASLGHNQQYTMEAYDCGEEKVAGLLLFTGSLSGSGGSASMLFVVDEVLWGLNESGEKCVEVTGLYGGRKVNMREYESGSINPSDLSQGDILTLDLSGSGEIKGYEKQFYSGDKPEDAAETAISENSPQYGDPYAFIYYAYGKVNTKKDGIISIEFANSESATYKSMTVYADSSDLSVYYIDKDENKVYIADSTYISDAKTVGESDASYVMIRVGSGDVKELIIFS